ncbi:MAG: SDR family oxidoreductase [Candidatus Glassbacteria bacterium]
MEDERILITGCGGMLGVAVYDIFSKTGADVLATDIDLNEDWLSHLDVGNIDECKNVFSEFKPTLVLHLAALTDLEYCERNREETWLVNALGTENIALLSRKYDCTLVYIGTAGIFDGRKEVYTDFDRPNPLSMYAKAKYHGEIFIQQFLSKYYIFRAGWMMGGGIKKDKKFINKIYKQIKAGKKELFVVDDKLGTPTYTVNFTESILKILPTGYYGLYNQVNVGGGSRFDVAVKYIEFLDLSDKVKVTKVDSDYFAQEYFAPRPHSEKLINLKLTARGINYMKNWEDCLDEYSETFRKDYYAKI